MADETKALPPPVVVLDVRHFKARYTKRFRTSIPMRSFSAVKVQPRTNIKANTAAADVHIICDSTSWHRGEQLRGTIVKEARQVTVHMSMDEACKCDALKGLEIVVLPEVRLVPPPFVETPHNWPALQQQQQSPAWWEDERLPSEIVRGKLYLGSQRHASSSAEARCVLDELGIRHVVNVTVDLPNAFQGEPGFEYLHIPVKDGFDEDISRYFSAVNDFIDGAPGPVLVHCEAGISRSATLVMAYIMHAEGMSYNEAYDFVKARRSRVSPNLHFLGHLLVYERLLTSQPLFRLPAQAVATTPTTPQVVAIGS